MSDLIRREDAIKAIMGDGLPELHCASWFADLIKDIPSVESGWIPVTKSLPAKNGLYIVSYDYSKWGEDVTGVDMAVYSTDENMFTALTLVSDSGEHPIVREWMPLPEPWKGAGE